MSGNQYDVNIVPAEKTVTKTVTNFTVSVVQLNLFTNVIVAVTTYDVDQNQIDSLLMDISGENYLAWNNNDQYIINYVANQLGFTIINSTTH